MKYFRMTLFTAAILICAIGVQAQTTGVVPQDNTAAAQTQETKNSVELVLEDLKKQYEPVVRGCFEPCSDAQKSQSQVKIGDAIEKPMPVYPAIAMAARATGTVVVAVVIDEEGNVIAARVASGHPLLQAAAVKAAKDSTFMPTTVAGSPVKVLATITYNFVML